MASSSSDPASFRQPKHEVFLSFRGEDTRNTFLYYLYDALRQKGVGAYADFKDLPMGEDTSRVLLQAIEESKISTIVFSPNYAFSSRCLEELSKIMECRQSRGQIVVPIFYHLNPSDVRNQTGSFRNAFVEHERNRRDKVQGWKRALKEVGNLSGFNVTGDKPELLVIEDIVLDIVNKLTPTESTQNRTIFTTAATKWGFLITNLVLEILTAICDQLSSPRRPLYALLGFLTSLSVLLICICELLYKGQKELVSWRRAGRPCYPFPYKRIFRNFAETFGFISAVFGCIFSTVAYIYFKQHENNPIKLNIFPIVFSASLACSMICREEDMDRDDAARYSKSGELAV